MDERQQNRNRHNFRIVCGVLLLIFIANLVFLEYLYSMKIYNPISFWTLIQLFTGGSPYAFWKICKVVMEAKRDKIEKILDKPLREVPWYVYVFCKIAHRIFELMKMSEKQLAWCIFLSALIFANPILCMAHPVDRLLNGGEYVIEKAKDIRSKLGMWRTDEFVNEDEQPPYGETESETESETGTIAEHASGNKAIVQEGKRVQQNIDCPVYPATINFYLNADNRKKIGEKKDIVNALVLYIEEDMCESEAYEKIKEHIMKLGINGEVGYADKVFSRIENYETANALHTKWQEFEKQILQGKSMPDMIPSSRALDEMIEGWETNILTMKDVSNEKKYSNTSALANCYLKYELEYINQEKIGDECLYYAGMAILAGEIQMCCASENQQRIDVLEWLYMRYKEICDLHMSNDVRYTIIANCLYDLKNDWAFLQEMEDIDSTKRADESVLAGVE